MSDFDTRVNDLVESIIDRQNDYLEECAEYAKSGHRHNYCFHGVNMWVDYDCACGLCEDGEINEYSSEEEIREYSKAIIEEEIAEEVAEEERRNQFISLLMQSKKAHSFLDAELIYNDLF